MMKILGTAMIAISSMLVALTYYNKYKTRPNSLEWFIKLITHYKFELKWRRNSLIQLVLDYANDEYSEYVSEIKYSASDDSLTERFIDNNSKFESLKLSKEDVIILRNFLNESGKSSLESELSLCDKTLSALEIQKNNATSDFNKMGSLALKLGVICTIWIIIMLI